MTFELEEEGYEEPLMVYFVLGDRCMPDVDSKARYTAHCMSMLSDKGEQASIDGGRYMFMLDGAVVVAIMDLRFRNRLICEPFEYEHGVQMIPEGPEYELDDD
jgi:hypothetical protein